MIVNGLFRLQTTQNQVIVEMWSGERKVSVYLDLDAQDTVQKAEAYRVEQMLPVEDSVSVVEALRWFAGVLKQGEVQQDLDDVDL